MRDLLKSIERLKNLVTIPAGTSDLEKVDEGLRLIAVYFQNNVPELSPGEADPRIVLAQVQVRVSRMLQLQTRVLKALRLKK